MDLLVTIELSLSDISNVRGYATMLLYKYFFGPFALLRLYITYEPASKA